ncbi:GNAT family N-acetyltransferase [Clostridium sp. BJN0013]|uniref:GNAT family N-acetyltransferase n=1 Tax=Clostridium sp. BJN0013 TaxID=3236840 RepID=UPI0034C5CFE1
MIEIYEYKNDYKDEITQMILKIQQEEYNLPITANDQPDLANIETFYQQNNGNFWADINKQVVIGTIAIRNIDNKNAMLRKMFVKQEYRGKDVGVSNNLLLKLLDWAKQKNLTRIFLGTTPQFLAAHRFYEKNGFKEIDKKELPANFLIMDVDKKFYCYSL